ncbi:leucine-rich repeat-containing protein kinase family protein [Duganella sp. Root336D2]|uniref:leucine-rich repeat-containing protein kinase family protein n=1 Tax=Duganella sp. Root336D2 TaxID=1736518 RepID=UPI0006F7BE15|nr:leucine-rich repeat-containing protein kinase family protein [Duganella sp. Root336D2]KQV54500.1 protein kinase [Duganella sp. Root336D2]
MQTLQQLRSGELAGAVRLQLRCALTEFPREIFDLAETLEILDLTGNSLSSLPDDLPRLRRLRIIFCSENQFTELPAVLGRCPSLMMIGFKANRITSVPAAALPPRLRWLILTDNRIEQLPGEIGKCIDMQKLMLSGNRLSALPSALANCSKLELLRISANRLPELPDWLPAMPRLAWLAFAGNPFSEAAIPPAASISWDELQIQHKLGEGASGVIHQAILNGEPVAVKVYKGAMTSDGLPAQETAACIGAGKHPNLIPVLGTIPDHPASLPALVMPLVDPDLRNLAGPPSFASCTRDVYADDQHFTTEALLGIARSIASAAAHLHERGIMHGDLYAHNILNCGKGNAVLGDFGGASCFAPGTVRASALERLEVRAFGYLLEELLERGEEELPQVRALANDCLHPAPETRPAFAEAAARLEAAD